MEGGAHNLLQDGLGIKGPRRKVEVVVEGSNLGTVDEALARMSRSRLQEI